MKTQKIFITAGLLLVVLVLAGCGQFGVSTENKTTSAPVSVSTTEPASVSVPSADNLQVALPETVSTKPGATADEEINNIDKDLQSLDDASLNQGLSDADLGL